MKTTGRSLYWDIFKGLAIIMIVFGHTGHGGAFVYLFHLELFFFLTCFLLYETLFGRMRSNAVFSPLLSFLCVEDSTS